MRGHYTYSASLYEEGEQLMITVVRELPPKLS